MAVDSTGADLTGQITRTVFDPAGNQVASGVVDTSRPSNGSWTIRYQVVSGGVVVAAQRRLTVVCQAGSSACSADNSGDAAVSALQCSEPSVCAIATASFGVSASSVMAATLAATPAATLPPRLTLIGTAVVYLTAGTPYKRCATTSPLDGSVTCERGANASDDQDGNLTPFIEACAPADSDAGAGISARFAVVGLAACRIPSVPGIFTITYSVVNSRGLSAQVSRTLVVRSAPVGQSLDDCMAGGSSAFTCLSSDDPDSSSPASSSSLASADQLLSSLAAGPPLAPAPPTIALKTTASLGTTVRLRPGTKYAVCGAGVEPTSRMPCELGAFAYDADGQELTGQVLACPPSECLPFGCPGYEFAVQGLTSCGLDGLENAVPGTVVTVSFVVFSLDLPASSARVQRQIVIAPDCPDGQRKCGDAGCVSELATCDAAANILAEGVVPAKPSITIQLSVALKGATPTGMLLHGILTGASPTARRLSQTTNAGSALSHINASSSHRHPGLVVQQQARPEYLLPKATSNDATSDIRLNGDDEPRRIPGKNRNGGQRFLQQSDALLRALEQAVLLDAASMVLYVPFAQRLPFSISPCESIAQLDSGACGVAAVDWQGNDLSDAVLSADVTTLIPTNSSTDTPTQQPLICSTSMADSGWCVPGAYSIQYTVLDASRRRATAALRLVVEQRVQLKAWVATLHVCQDATSAEGLALSAAKIASSNATWLGVLSTHLVRLGIPANSLRRVTLDTTTATSPPWTTAGRTLDSLCVVNSSLTLQVACNMSAAGGSWALCGCPAPSGQVLSELAAQQAAWADPAFSLPVPGAGGILVSGQLAACAAATPEVTPEALTVAALRSALAATEQGVRGAAAGVAGVALGGEGGPSDLVQYDEYSDEMDWDEVVLYLRKARSYVFDLGRVVRSICIRLGLPGCANFTMPPFDLDFDPYDLIDLEALAGGGAVDPCLKERARGKRWDFVVNTYGGATLSSGDDAPARKRRVLDVHGSQVVGGLLLHLERRPVAATVVSLPTPGNNACASRFASTLVSACAPLSQLELALMAESCNASIAAGLTCGESRRTLPGIGVDPVFLPSSPLYDRTIASRKKDWYNLSDSDQLNFASYPFGFFPQHVPGAPAGYPLVLSLDLPEERWPEVMERVRYGRYLDRVNARRLTAQVATFSHVRHCFGLWQAVIEWTDSGAILAHLRLRVLPAGGLLGVQTNTGDNATFRVAVDSTVIALVALNTLWLLFKLVSYAQGHWQQLRQWLRSYTRRLLKWVELENDPSTSGQKRPLAAASFNEQKPSAAGDYSRPAAKYADSDSDSTASNEHFNTAMANQNSLYFGATNFVEDGSVRRGSPANIETLAQRKRATAASTPSLGSGATYSMNMFPADDGIRSAVPRSFSVRRRRSTMDFLKIQTHDDSARPVGEGLEEEEEEEDELYGLRPPRMPDPRANPATTGVPAGIRSLLPDPRTAFASQPHTGSGPMGQVPDPRAAPHHGHSPTTQLSLSPSLHSPLGGGPSSQIQPAGSPAIGSRLPSRVLPGDPAIGTHPSGQMQPESPAIGTRPSSQVQPWHPGQTAGGDASSGPSSPGDPSLLHTSNEMEAPPDAHASYLQYRTGGGSNQLTRKKSLGSWAGAELEGSDSHQLARKQSLGGWAGPALDGSDSEVASRKQSVGGWAESPALDQPWSSLEPALDHPDDTMMATFDTELGTFNRVSRHEEPGLGNFSRVSRYEEPTARGGTYGQLFDNPMVGLDTEQWMAQQLPSDAQQPCADPATQRPSHRALTGQSSFTQEPWLDSGPVHELSRNAMLSPEPVLPMSGGTAPSPAHYTLLTSGGTSRAAQYALPPGGSSSSMVWSTLPTSCGASSAVPYDGTPLISSSGTKHSPVMAMDAAHPADPGRSGAARAITSVNAPPHAWPGLSGTIGGATSPAALPQAIAAAGYLIHKASPTDSRGQIVSGEQLYAQEDSNLLHGLDSPSVNEMLSKLTTEVPVSQPGKTRSPMSASTIQAAAGATPGLSTYPTPGAAEAVAGGAYGQQGSRQLSTASRRSARHLSGRFSSGRVSSASRRMPSASGAQRRSLELMSPGSGQVKQISSMRQRSIRMAANVPVLKSQLMQVQEAGATQGHPGTSTKWTPSREVTGTNLLYDAFVVALMLAAIVMMILYAQQGNAGLPTRARYSLYDADAHAPANMFMLPVDPSRPTEGSQVPAAGQPGRWEVIGAGDAAGLQQLAADMQDLGSMADMQTAYGLLQCAVLLLLFARLVGLCLLQPRLGLIPQTLISAAPGLIHLALVLVPCAIMAACALTLCAGVSQPDLSSLAEVMVLQLKTLVAGDAMGLWQAVEQGIVGMPAAQATLVRIVAAASVMFLHFLATTWVVAALLTVFQPLRIGAVNQIGLAAEIKILMRWARQSTFEGAPSLNELQALMDQALQKRSRLQNLPMRDLLSLMLRAHSMRRVSQQGQAGAGNSRRPSFMQSALGVMGALRNPRRSSQGGGLSGQLEGGGRSRRASMIALWLPNSTSGRVAPDRSASGRNAAGQIASGRGPQGSGVLASATMDGRCQTSFARASTDLSRGSRASWGILPAIADADVLVPRFSGSPPPSDSGSNALLWSDSVAIAAVRNSPFDAKGGAFPHAGSLRRQWHSAAVPPHTPLKCSQTYGECLPKPQCMTSMQRRTSWLDLQPPDSEAQGRVRQLAEPAALPRDPQTAASGQRANHLPPRRFQSQGNLLIPKGIPSLLLTRPSDNTWQAFKVPRDRSPARLSQTSDTLQQAARVLDEQPPISPNGQPAKGKHPFAPRRTRSMANLTAKGLPSLQPTPSLPRRPPSSTQHAFLPLDEVVVEAAEQLPMSRCSRQPFRVDESVSEDSSSHNLAPKRSQSHIPDLKPKAPVLRARASTSIRRRSALYTETAAIDDPVDDDRADGKHGHISGLRGMLTEVLSRSVKTRESSVRHLTPRRSVTQSDMSRRKQQRASEASGRVQWGPETLTGLQASHRRSVPSIPQQGGFSRLSQASYDGTCNANSDHTIAWESSPGSTGEVFQQQAGASASGGGLKAVLTGVLSSSMNLKAKRSSFLGQSSERGSTKLSAGQLFIADLDAGKPGPSGKPVPDTTNASRRTFWQRGSGSSDASILQEGRRKSISSGADTVAPASATSSTLPGRQLLLRKSMLKRVSVADAEIAAWTDNAEEQRLSTRSNGLKSALKKTRSMRRSQASPAVSWAGNQGFPEIPARPNPPFMLADIMASQDLMASQQDMQPPQTAYGPGVPDGSSPDPSSHGAHGARDWRTSTRSTNAKRVQEGLVGLTARGRRTFGSEGGSESVVGSSTQTIVQDQQQPQRCIGAGQQSVTASLPVNVRVAAAGLLGCTLRAMLESGLSLDRPAVMGAAAQAVDDAWCGQVATNMAAYPPAGSHGMVPSVKATELRGLRHRAKLLMTGLQELASGMQDLSRAQVSLSHELNSAMAQHAPVVKREPHPRSEARASPTQASGAGLARPKGTTSMQRGTSQLSLASPITSSSANAQWPSPMSSPWGHSMHRVVGLSPTLSPGGYGTHRDGGLSPTLSPGMHRVGSLSPTLSPGGYGMPHDGPLPVMMSPRGHGDAMDLHQAGPSPIMGPSRHQDAMDLHPADPSLVMSHAGYGVLTAGHSPIMSPRGHGVMGLRPAGVSSFSLPRENNAMEVPQASPQPASLSVRGYSRRAMPDILM